MAIERDLASIVREVIQFLECLREVKLPSALESIRDSLLTRSKDTLTSFVTIRRCASPEPYLNMNMKAATKGLSGIPALSDLQEYIGCEEPRTAKHQDHYESFQSVACERKEEDTENVLANIYAGLSAAQTRSKCHKCGPLYRKEGKKLFVFEQYRMCWVGLVGSYLLIYGNDRDGRPSMIQSIRGYMARPAPNAMPRDQRRAESAFEIFRPGSRTLQFIGRTPKDMEQWVAKVCQMSSGDKEELALESSNPSSNETDVRKVEPREEPAGIAEEQYQDVGSFVRNGGSFDDAPTAVSTSENPNPSPPPPPPPLPARIPRRLPSLPVEDTIRNSQQRHADDEEDDIYYKIEDFRDSGQYQNVRCDGQGEEEEDLVDYDDVRERRTRRRRRTEEEEVKDKEQKVNEEVEAEMTYDDVASAIARDKRENRTSVVGTQQERKISYDDVESLLPDAKPTKSTEKSGQKKSFLDRVRSRRESPRKVEKKSKRKAGSSSERELPTYDDATAVVGSVGASSEEEMPEYNCPPPPRPLLANSTPVLEPLEFYDDVAAVAAAVTAYRESCRDSGTNNRADQVGERLAGQTKSVDDGSQEESNRCEEVEHYQTPRNELCQPIHARADQQEELYDDIALLVDFTARQRASPSRKDTDDAKTTSAEKKPWNRFVSGRKAKSSSDENNRFSNGSEDADEHNENPSLIRMNTFQKLISKMENSLGKASTRTQPMPFNKTNGISNT